MSSKRDLNSAVETLIVEPRLFAVPVKDCRTFIVVEYYVSPRSLLRDISIPSAEELRNNCNLPPHLSHELDSLFTYRVLSITRDRAFGWGHEAKGLPQAQSVKSENIIIG